MGVDRMDVIGVGFGRTGTLSLKVALERLGLGPCYHMREVLRQPARIKDWFAVADGACDWPRIFAGYRSTVDWPAAAYWRALVDAYPAARVILTVRDPDRWYASAERTLYQQSTRIRQNAPRGTTTAESSLSATELAEFGRMADVTVWDRVFGGRFADRDHALAVFEEHTRQVTVYLPADRLLVYDIGDGWAPLCGFLGLPVPATPFPHDNESSSFDDAAISGCGPAQHDTAGTELPRSAP
jgi:hypothetical protein